MQEKQFEIELLDIHWLENTPEEMDFCAHGQVKVRIGHELIVDRSEKEQHWTLSAMSVHLLRTIDNNHNPENLVGEQLIPCCGYHFDHLDNSSDVHIQGCFTGVNFWVQHMDQAVKLITESQTEVIIPKKEYVNEVKNFVDKVEEFYKTSKTKQMSSDQYEQTGYVMMWKEWKRRRTQMDTK